MVNGKGAAIGSRSGTGLPDDAPSRLYPGSVASLYSLDAANVHTTAATTEQFIAYFDSKVTCPNASQSGRCAAFMPRESVSVAALRHPFRKEWVVVELPVVGSVADMMRAVLERIPPEAGIHLMSLHFDLDLTRYDMDMPLECIQTPVLNSDVTC